MGVSMRTMELDPDIRFGVSECWLGRIAVAATTKGICAILLGDDAGGVVHDLLERFSAARPIDDGDEEFGQTVETVVELVRAAS